MFRPGVEYYRHVRRVLSQALQEVNYPRDDVVKLVDDVRGVFEDLRGCRASISQLRAELQRTGTEAANRSEENRRRTDGVARKFEETIDRLTDNQEIISGIKAFLRLLQRPGPLVGKSSQEELTVKPR